MDFLRKKREEPKPPSAGERLVSGLRVLDTSIGRPWGRLVEAGSGAGVPEEACLAACALLAVLAAVLVAARRGRRARKALVVLGSGGHTSEMLSMLRAMPPGELMPERVFLVANTDTNSEGRLQASFRGARVIRTPRAREVGQSWASTVLTTLVALAHAVLVVFWEAPDVVLCNGPGTCVPVAWAAVAMRIAYLKRCRVIFCESIARVEHLSLSGKLLYPIADRFFVQWEQLARKYRRAKYVGFVI